MPRLDRLDRDRLRRWLTQQDAALFAERLPYSALPARIERALGLTVSVGVVTSELYYLRTTGQVRFYRGCSDRPHCLRSFSAMRPAVR